MPWLEKANHSPCPSPVDSCGVAGLIDVLRCQGVWYKVLLFLLLLFNEQSNILVSSVQQFILFAGVLRAGGEIRIPLWSAQKVA